MSGYYNRAGEPIDLWEWTAAFEGDRRVARKSIGDINVSTVYLGLDHSFGAGPPLIFETMIFGHDRDTELLWRYPTEEAALAGHDRVLAWVRAGMRADREPE